MPAPSELTARISQLYRYTDADVRQLTEMIFQQRRDVWRSTITAELRSIGVTRASSRPPSGRDLRYLEKISKEDAESIANTWNKWVERRIDELWDANPKGNRQYFFSNLERLAAERDAHHQRLIALNTDSTTVQYAKERFVEENGLQDSHYEYSGPSPVSDECKDRFADGIVTYEYIRRNPVPAHPRCPHQWERVSLDAAFDVADIWIG